MEKEKNIILTKNYYLRENIQIIKDGMGKVMMKMVIICMNCLMVMVK